MSSSVVHLSLESDSHQSQPNAAQQMKAPLGMQKASVKEHKGGNFYVERKPAQVAAARRHAAKGSSSRRGASSLSPRRPGASVVTMSLDGLAGSAATQQQQQKTQQKARGNVAKSQDQDATVAVPARLLEDPGEEGISPRNAAITGHDVRRRSQQYEIGRRLEEALKSAHKELYEAEENRDIQARIVERLMREVEDAKNELEEVEDETRHLRASIDVRRKELSDVEEDLIQEELYKEVMEGPPLSMASSEGGNNNRDGAGAPAAADAQPLSPQELTPDKLQAIITDLKESIDRRRTNARASSDVQRASLQQEIEKLRLEVEMKQTQIRKVDQEIAHAKEEKNRLEAESRQLDEAYAEEEKDLEMLEHDIERARQLSAQERGARRGGEVGGKEHAGRGRPDEASDRDRRNDQRAASLDNLKPQDPEDSQNYYVLMPRKSRTGELKSSLLLY